MHEQAQLRQKKDEVEKLGAVALLVVAMDLHRTKAFKEKNLLLSTFKNPFTHTGGQDVAWENRANMAADPSAIPGIVSYAGAAPGDQYNIKAFGRQTKLTVVLTSGN